MRTKVVNAVGTVESVGGGDGKNGLPRAIRVALALGSTLPLGAGLCVAIAVVGCSAWMIIGVCAALATGLLSAAIFCFLAVGAAFCALLSVLLGAVSLLLFTFAALCPVVALWVFLFSTAPPPPPPQTLTQPTTTTDAISAPNSPCNEDTGVTTSSCTSASASANGTANVNTCASIGAGTGAGTSVSNLMGTVRRVVLG